MKSLQPVIKSPVNKIRLSQQNTGHKSFAAVDKKLDFQSPCVIAKDKQASSLQQHGTVHCEH